MLNQLQIADLIMSIQIYFQGEKNEALVFILPMGLLSMVFSVWLLTDNPSNFAKGVAIPFLVLGLLMCSVGSVVGFRTPSQVNGIIKAVEVDQSSALKSEQQRMSKVDKAWSMYLMIWVLFGVGGLVLRFVLDSDFYQGLGIALVFFAGVGLLIDGFAERRTHPYIDTLNTMSIQLEK